MQLPKKRGGGKSITLTNANLPSHTHSIAKHAHTTPNHTHTWNGTTGAGGEHSHSFYYPQSNVFGFSMHTSEDGHAKLGTGFSGSFAANVKECYASINGVGNHTHTYSGTTSSNNGGNTGEGGPTATGSTGSGMAVSVLQPYVTCYIWKRTA